MLHTSDCDLACNKRRTLLPYEEEQTLRLDTVTSQTKENIQHPMPDSVNLCVVEQCNLLAHLLDLQARQI